MRTKSFAVPALGLSMLALSLLSGCEKGGSDRIVDVDPDIHVQEPKVAVAPQAVTLQVGDAAQLVAVVAGLPAGASSAVRWLSLDTRVATVSGSGVVTCNADGTTSVVASAEAAPSASDRAAVTCNQRPDPPRPSPTPTPSPTPPPPPNQTSLIGLDKSSLSLTYARGSSCPVNVGEFMVTNRSHSRIRVTMRAGSDSIELTPDAWELGPGQPAPHGVMVKFNCIAQASFATQITVTATDGSTTETKRVDVRVTIQ